MSKRIDVAGSVDVREGKLFAARAEGLQLLLSRVDGRAFAVENKCAHFGLPMTRGKLDGANLQCPWHGSRFDFCSGRNLDWVNSFAGMPMPRWSHGLIAMGKEPAALRIFDTAEEGGRVFVSVPD